MPTDPNEINKIGIATTNPYWDVTPDYTVKTYGLTDRTSDMEKDIDNLKNMVLHQQSEIRRLTIESEERAYQVQQVSKDLRTLAVEIPKPYEVANLALDKLHDFILAFKEVRTTSSGITQEVIPVQKVLGAINKIKEVMQPNDSKRN